MLRKRELQGLLGRVFIAAGLLLGGAAAGWGEEKPDPAQPNAAKEAKDAGGREAPATLTVEKLTETTRKSVVVVTVLGRDGRQQGLGSGVIISDDGLIATNLHVIGEARPIAVQTTDGKRFDVTEVRAFDRPLDLALIKIDARGLPALPLGDSDELKQGQAVIAIGNPQGLKHSVVTGVVSGTREIEGRQMIQLAIPIEPGNSGGPLLDMQGRVHGLLTMKSAVTENLGFAMPVNALKPMIAKPNPTPIARWLTIGALDAKEWKPLFGARWRQRAGRIMVDGLGQGFGGRSLCLSEQVLPETPYEIAVSVKLDNEEGAAGLVLCSDGGDVHYGFYPSNGKLRFSRFDGPDVFSWKVIQDVKIEQYRPGDWNTLKVRFEKGKIECFVNDGPAFTVTDDKLAAGKAGLAKFRTTEAEFRNFQVAKEIVSSKIADDVAERIAKLAADLPVVGPIKDDVAEKLAADGSIGVAVLRDRAKRMEQQAAQLRRLAQAAHQRRVQTELAKLLEAKDAEIDLFHAALLVAQLDNDEVDVAAYRKELERMGREISDGLPKEADETAKVAALNKYLFDELGFHGSRGDYYHRSNSYVNEVLDDREGLPITLSVIYLELARKLGVKVVGVGLPGHFVVRHEPEKGDAQLIDVYERGKFLSKADAEKMVRDATNRAVREPDLATAPKRTIIVRMLHNLLGLTQRSQDFETMLRYLDTILAVQPETGEERWMRAVLRYRTGRKEEAIQDTDWLLENRPSGVDLNQVDALRRELERGG